jgi:hypothetical protein
MKARGYAEFEFDLSGALVEQVDAAFDKVGPRPLLEEEVADLPNAHGVYKLLLGGDVVYIGKTSSTGGLRVRLSKHARRVRHRVGLEPGAVTFKALKVLVFKAVDLEAGLIARYRRDTGLRTPPPWNGGGFGANDPGGRRDGTRLKPTGFDARHPVDIDIPLVDFPTDEGPAGTYEALRAALPYPVRLAFPDGDRAAGLPAGGAVEIVQPATARSVLRGLLAGMPPGWQATALAGRVVIAPRIDDAPEGGIVARSPGSPPTPTS